MGYVGDTADLLRPCLYADADLGGCPDSQRSTTGAHLCIRGPKTNFPIHGESKRQGSVSHSTPEAEIVALDHAVRTIGLPAANLWEKLMGSARLEVYEDNDAAIRCVRTGRNPTMRHLGRTHGICIAWLHEQYARSAFSLHDTASCMMSADIYTKSFINGEQWDAACWLVNICREDDIETLCMMHDMPPPQTQGGSPQKLGVWSLNSDGAGKWSRTDYASRYRVPYKAGPRLEEVHTRVTTDSATGEILETKRGFQTCTKRDDLIPSPRPRRILSEFHFCSTCASIPKRAVAGEMDADRAIHGVGCRPKS